MDICVTMATKESCVSMLTEVGARRPVKVQVQMCNEDIFEGCGYQALGIIGHGMSGQVILAQMPDGDDEDTGNGTDLEAELKTVAVKLIPKATKNGFEYTEKMFLQEVAILNEIDHTGIVKNIAAYQCPEEYAMVMPYFQNGNLKRHLPDLTPALTDRYFLQLASALLYLHTCCGIVHRDIKPDNVLVGDNRDVLLSDFGLAKALPLPVSPSCSSTPAKACGTHGYMAPELTNPMRIVSNLYKCDMYSLGVVLWCMLLRRPGAPGLAYLTLLRARGQQIHVGYQCLLEGLLDSNPRKRLAVTDLIRAVTNWPHMLALLQELPGFDVYNWDEEEEEADGK